MNWTPFAILGGLVLEGICALIERHAVRGHPRKANPPFRVFQYGILEPGVWFFVMKLPSWQWALVDYGRRLAWCQLQVAWTSESGWMHQYVPE
jgi:hypothetical protein